MLYAVVSFVAVAVAVAVLGNKAERNLGYDAVG